MLEDLMQHSGSMVLTVQPLILEAREFGDTSHDEIDFFKLPIMCMLHDVEEVLIGDARSKDEAYYLSEEEARGIIFDWLHSQLRSASVLEEFMQEYKQRKTDTARYAKVTDEFQAWLYMIHTRGFSETTRDFTNLQSIEGYRLSEPFTTTREVMSLAGRIIRHPQFITADIPPMPFDT